MIVDALLREQYKKVYFFGLKSAFLTILGLWWLIFDGSVLKAEDDHQPNLSISVLIRPNLQLFLPSSFQTAQSPNTNAELAGHLLSSDFPTINILRQSSPLTPSKRALSIYLEDVTRSYTLVGLTDATVSAGEITSFDECSGYRVKLIFSRAGHDMYAELAAIPSGAMEHLLITFIGRRAQQDRDQKLIEQILGDLKVTDKSFCSSTAEQSNSAWWFIGLGLLVLLWRWLKPRTKTSSTH